MSDNRHLADSIAALPSSLLESSTVPGDAERRFMQFMRHLPGLAWIKDLAGRYVFVNDAAARAFGRTREQIIGRSDDELFGVETAGQFRDNDRRALEGGGLQTIEALSHDDGVVHQSIVSKFPIPGSDGRPMLLGGMAIDVTEGIRASEALRDSEARFRTLADNISQLAWMADEKGWIFWYNRRWLEYTGATVEQMQGWGWTAVHHPDHVDRVVARIQRSWDTGEPWEDTFPLRGADGRYRWFLSRAMPIRDAEGRIIRWFGTNTDVTEQRRVEAQLIEARDAAEAANRAKDRFLAVLSHELRTPLTPVLMTVSAMQGDPDIPARVRDEVAMIRRNVELETKLIDDLLDLSRIASGKLQLQFQAADLNEVTREVCHICDAQIREKRIRLLADYDKRIARIKADPARLQQVLWNVLKNAVKFTPDGGEIQVTTSRLEGGRARLEVRDSGRGIDPQVLPRIFEAFEQGDAGVTRQFGGLGLGLAISRAIVEMHHGTIRAESPGAGRGSIFTVDLPCELEAAATAPSADPGTPAPQRPALRLLIVEDHADTARVLGRLLGARGYCIQVADGVAEALDLARRERFDVVLSDIGLPDGTGFDLMAALRREHGLKGIAMSGYGTEEDFRRSREAGFSNHLVKPISVSQLDEAIRSMC